jgi:hypothetical protein
MDLQEIGWGRKYWIYLTLDRKSWKTLVNAVLNHQGPKYLGTCYFLRKDFVPRS